MTTAITIDRLSDSHKLFYFLRINNQDKSGSRTRHCAIRTKARPKQCYPESTREQTMGGKTVSVIESCACR